MHPNNPRPPHFLTTGPPMGVMPQGYMAPQIPAGRMQQPLMAPLAYPGVSIPTGAYGGSVPPQFYHQQRAYLQQMAAQQQVAAQAARPRQEAPPSGKSMHFVTQQQKLKAFGVKGVKAPTVSMDGLIESMFGKTPHKIERKISATAQMPETKASTDPQPTRQSSNPVIPVLAHSAPITKKQAPAKSLEVMMQECTDITAGVERARSFRKAPPPAPSETKHSASSTTQQPTSRFPAWCCTAQAPPIYLEVERLSSVDGRVDNGRLLPLLMSSGLQRELLAHIWEAVSKEQAGSLAPQELYAALALVALCQAGYQVTGPEVLHMLGTPPVPTFMIPQGEEQQQGPPSTQSPAPVLCPSPNLPTTEGTVTSTEDDEFDDFKQASWDPQPASTTIPTQTMVMPALPIISTGDKYSVFMDLQVDDKPNPTTENQTDDFGDFLSADLDSLSIASTQETVQQNFTPNFPVFSSEQQQQLFEESFPGLGASIFGANPECNMPPFHANFADFDAQSPDAFTRSPTNEDSPDEEFGSFTQSGALQGTDSKLGETQSVASLELASGEADLSRHGSSQSLDSKSPGASLGAIVPVSVKHHQRSVSDGQGLTKTIDRDCLEPSESSISLVEDRYSYIHKEKAKTGISCLQQLSLCLTSCLRLLEASLDIFTQMSSTEVFYEVLGAKEVLDYIQNLKEVFTVTQRIRASTAAAGNVLQLQDSLGRIRDVWIALANIIGTPQHPSIPAGLSSPAFDFSFALLGPGTDQSMACGVCLLNVDAPGTSCWPGSPASQVKLSYGRRHYHATCANLWLNCVDPILPILTISELGIC